MERVDICALSRCSKTIERPGSLRLFVTENIKIAVVSENSKITRFGRIPAPGEFADFIGAAGEDETEWAFVCAVARVTFDAKFVHRASAGLKGFRRRKRRTANRKHSIFSNWGNGASAGDSL